MSTAALSIRPRPRRPQVESAHTAEVSDIIQELCAAGAAELGVGLAGGEVARLLAYARSVAHFPTAVKEVSVPVPGR